MIGYNQTRKHFLAVTKIKTKNTQNGSSEPQKCQPCFARHIDQVEHEVFHSQCPPVAQNGRSSQSDRGYKES